MVELIVEEGEGLPDADSYASLAFAQDYFANGSAPVAWVGARAAGWLALIVQPSDGQTVTIDGRVYTFEAALTDVDGHVALGADVATTRENLLAALQLDPDTVGTAYATSTTAHDTVEGVAVTGVRIDLAALLFGTWGNAITLTTNLTAPNAVSAATFVGGLDPTLTPQKKRTALRQGTAYLGKAYGTRWAGRRANADQALDHPRAGLKVGGYGIESDVVHPLVPQATCEAALRSTTAATGLLPDVVKPGAVLQEVRELGPLKKSTTWASGASPLPKWSEVDALVKPLLEPAGRAWRGG